MKKIIKKILKEDQREVYLNKIIKVIKDDFPLIKNLKDYGFYDQLSKDELNYVLSGVFGRNVEIVPSYYTQILNEFGKLLYIEVEDGCLEGTFVNYLEDINNIDSTEDIVYLPTESSGTILGSLTVDDGEGGVSSEPFTIEVQTRKFKVNWVEETLVWNYDDYLAQGETWSDNMTPGEGVRIIAYEALLELDQDLILPPDNFTLSLKVTEDAYKRSAQTSPGNVTRNESTMAELEDSDLNPTPEEGIYDSDSADDLLRSLLTEPGARFGQGEWIWSIVAQNADPDSIIPGAPDPDGGNDYTLRIEITVLTPVLTEVAYD